MSAAGRRRRGPAPRRLLIVVLVIGALAVGLRLRAFETRPHASPDGAFVATVFTGLVDHLYPAMPGGGSDGPGMIGIRTRDGRFCGAAPLPMRWLIGDLRWHIEARPRQAVLVGIAVWDLDACTVDTTGW